MTVTSLNQARPKQPLSGHVDVLIVGAGISGIGMGHYLVNNLPGKTFAIVDGRDTIGGTCWMSPVNCATRAGCMPKLRRQGRRLMAKRASSGGCEPGHWSFRRR